MQSPELNESAWQYACDKANAGVLSALNESEAKKFEAETVDAYAARIIGNVEASYLAEQERDMDDVLRKAPADMKAKWMEQAKAESAKLSETAASVATAKPA